MTFFSGILSPMGSVLSVVRLAVWCHLPAQYFVDNRPLSIFLCDVFHKRMSGSPFIGLCSSNLFFLHPPPTLAKISASADGGPRSRVCARWTLRLAPHRHERKFFGAHVCRVTFKHLPQPLRSHIQSFITLGQLFKIPPCPPKYVIVRGVGGSTI